jgi:hypothetical protein
MYVNGKWDLLKLFQEWGEGIKENDGGVNSSMIYLTYCKNFCKCHNIPQHNNKNKLIKTMKRISKKKVEQIRNEVNLIISFQLDCLFLWPSSTFLPLTTKRTSHKAVTKGAFTAKLGRTKACLLNR